MATESVQQDERPRPLRVIVPVLIVVAVVLAIGIVPRIFQQSALKADAAVEKHAVFVDVTSPEPGPHVDMLNVRGTIEAYEQTAVNARATGYAEKVLVNIGDRV